ncbi:hypothetical protein [Neorhizobium galegae]|nr:hypothetical protein [Neorhizobium galegae]MCM2500065.1 hypothetical protein [Neorhizobium galegae]MCQ1768097.1 hypothetical protein [Neorhizobium galegae]MCQ1775112.1 hypothetical protein [Neorhizobium galegae]MCQ1775902.1 hypothetical protein [Neorhizobium galegae]MCQ1797922.1 hypothetical protein [Neorhizobium galegae]
MKPTDRYALAVTAVFSFVIFSAVYATHWWMTDDAGKVDTKSSVTEPPK